MGYIEDMKAAIEKQIEGIAESSTVYACAHQLIDIVGNDERLAQLVCEDFANGRTVKDCESEIKKEADKIEKEHHSKNSKEKSHTVGMSPFYVEKIIRKYFGLGSASEQPTAAALTTVSAPKPKVISFADMLAGLE